MNELFVHFERDLSSVDIDLEQVARENGDATIKNRTATAARLTANLECLEFLARGGLGEVYRARHDALGRDVAVKLIRPHLLGDAESCRRFAWEARITAKLEHPGIVPIYGIGVDDEGHDCYAMRLVEGETLTKAIAAYHATDPHHGGQVARNKALRFLVARFKSACVTVAYAHSQGVIHRDLKPDNIMLGPFEETLVLDWGLAKLLEPAGAKEQRAAANFSATGDQNEERFFETRGTIGTLGYMSPEQHAGDAGRLGLPGDIYSLGATLYVLLTGRPPFEELCQATVAAKVARGEFVPPRQKNPTVARALEAVCLKAMALLPADRYPSAQQLADDLENWLADRPVTAMRDPWPTRTRRWVSGHRTFSAGFLVAAVFAFVAGALLIYRENVAAIREHEQALRLSTEINDLAYSNDEKTAREQISEKRPEWATRGLEVIRLAMATDSRLRSPTGLRRLAVECLGGVTVHTPNNLYSRFVFLSMNYPLPIPEPPWYPFKR
jgi:eukaryotic-like serine/threonine-protein kinase